MCKPGGRPSSLNFYLIGPIIVLRLGERALNLRELFDIFPSRSSVAASSSSDCSREIDYGLRVAKVASRGNWWGAIRDAPPRTSSAFQGYIVPGWQQMRKLQRKSDESTLLTAFDLFENAPGLLVLSAL